MQLQPAIDKEFKNASSFLKSVLKDYVQSANALNIRCLDAPCGNGRNSFLLASYFEQVTAVDIDQRYLDCLNADKAEYELKNIETVCLDILTQKLEDISQYGLVCNIHFYYGMFTRQLLAAMANGALLLIETPACHGQNFMMLPSEAEVNNLFAAHHVLHFEFKVCKHPYNHEQRGALKALIKI
jgi:SAM-dependent methyltransferase